MSKNGNKIVHQYYELYNKNRAFIVIRDEGFEKRNISIKNKENLVIVFDFEDLSKTLDLEKAAVFISNNRPSELIIKNCLIEKISNFFKDLKLDLKTLYISDELYRMSPNLKVLFENVKSKKLVLKKIKINSRLQLKNFFDFIINTKCEELVLDDIFIELIIKEDENDEKYNDLEKFLFFEEGKFFINMNDYEKPKETNLKKVTMIDCPLFAIKKNTFKNIKDYKDISIDIDENSLLNPSIITKFKINKGYSDICFDLDSYKLNEDDEKDYLDYIDYIFKLLIDDNYNYHKIKIKNFDITKYEYITGDNLTFIEEKNWVLNKEEKERKSRFEEKINKIIKNNLDKSLNIKELIFDNCSNNLIDLILRLVSKKKELELDYLKIKKCGKEYFDLSNILSFHIKHLILFDTPLIIGPFQKDKNTRLECYKGNFRRVDYLTIKISSLEHYCVSNNLDYYRTIEIIVELITHQNFNNNLCFEMNALPVIMTFLIAREYNKKYNLQKKIPAYFDFEPSEKVKRKIEQKVEEQNKSKGKEDKNEKEGKEGKGEKEKIIINKINEEVVRERDHIVKNTFKLNGMKEKNITLKNNNIRNKLENFDFYYYSNPIYNEEERKKKKKSDFGKDIFNLDIDYKCFFFYNKIPTINFENCLFSDDYKNISDTSKAKETIKNLMNKQEKNYKFDMSSLNEILFKNKNIENLSFLIKYFSLKKESSDNEAYLNDLNCFFNNLHYIFEKIKESKNKITIKFNNIKERKEFFCTLCLLNLNRKNFQFYEEENNGKKIFNSYEKEKDKDKEKQKEKKTKFSLPNSDELKKQLEPYFLKTKMKDEINKEQELSCVFDYYNTSDEEKKLFGEFDEKKEEIQFLGYSFKIEYNFNDEWEIIMK